MAPEIFLDVFIINNYEEPKIQFQEEKQRELFI